VLDFPGSCGVPVLRAGRIDATSKTNKVSPREAVMGKSASRRTAIRAAALAAMFAAAPAAANAAPILYNVVFDATEGSSGTGSFLYDTETGTGSDFVWDFGGGRTGGFPDFASPSFVGTAYRYATTGVSGSTGTFAFSSSGGLDGFPDNTIRFCAYTDTRNNCDVPVLTGFAAYEFVDQSGIYRGYFTLADRPVPRAVPEPGTLGLLGAGLAMVGFLRRARA
jgi:hypothetical protein